MRKVWISLCMAAIAGTAQGKAVDVNTAQAVAYNFLKPKAQLQDITALSLAYTRTTIVNGADVADFYIFNTASGFVIVSGDDQVMPVLGYSTESTFSATGISPSVQYLLGNYASQISDVILKNIPASPAIANKWQSLVAGSAVKSTSRTTAVSVTPLLSTKWDQLDQFGPTLTYNADCPFDSNATVPGPTLTGCVATAMSQVMKYWNWPDTGMGSNSYTQYPNPDNIPAQSANFAIPFYFDSMNTTYLRTANPYVANLMYCAGVSVNMDYGTTAEDGSGAYVTSAYSPVENCAEFALKSYFKYPQSTGYMRNRFNQAQWIDTMINEMTSGRPVIYAGDGSAGGHCWVMDGFDNDSFFHFNFGWSGSDNGYYTINNIDPNDIFDNDQEAIVRIIPDTPVHIIQTAVATVAPAAGSVNVFPNPATTEVNISMEGITVKQLTITDIDGREIKQLTPANSTKIITIPVTEFPDGVYILRLQTEQGILTRKFVGGEIISLVIYIYLKRAYLIRYALFYYLIY